MVPVPPERLQVILAEPSATMSLRDVPVLDAHDLKHSLTGGPTVPATISWDIQWSGLTRRVIYNDNSKGFYALAFEDTATIRWSAKQSGFSFVADPGTSTFAEIGYERNGFGNVAPSPP